MSILKSGQAHVEARARLMLLLGEQLITDEIAAVSELLKNSYDADAKEVTLTLSHVSESEGGFICVKDNGHGMTKDKVISSWLELGTLSKARGKSHEPRKSESGKRICLGEKGLGRLAVHKLGSVTELITRRVDENIETRLTIDWTAFEKNEGFLGDVPIKWEVTEPQVFTDPKYPQGTQITIKKLQRPWTKDMVERVYRSAKAIISPFADIVDFNIEVKIDDKFSSEIVVPNIADIVKEATYKFDGKVDTDGVILYTYEFHRPDIAGLKREKVDYKKDICNPKYFLPNQKSRCGSFKVKFYAWDLSSVDKKAVFQDISIYNDMVKPNSGVKVFRDGFRVLPYGNENNDWLSMDMGRVRQFEKHLSRNQIIGAIEITTEQNPMLLDKTDREGLIDNESFKDFISLIKSALTEFEAERFIDRRELKRKTGRIQLGSVYKDTFSQNFVALSRMLGQSSQIDGETRLAAQRLITEAREAFEKVLARNEQPLLVAASIGLTYMIPTHEIQRDLHAALKLLPDISTGEEDGPNKIREVTSLLKNADSTVRGMSKLMQQSQQEEIARPLKVANTALQLLRSKCQRNKIIAEVEGLDSIKVKGSERMLTVLLLNFLDNSIYWLLKMNENERRIKILVRKENEDCLLIVSDSGPGFEDDIEIVTLPFFSRKPNGMGLGLYIAERIAKMNGGQLKIFQQNELPGLLPGANIAVVLKTIRGD